MLSITIVEFILRAIPEAFIHIFAMYGLTGTTVDKRAYLKSSIVLSMIMFAVRALPISYGIHTILIIMGIIGLSVTINKLNIIAVIRASIINVVIQFIAEGINILFIENILNKNLQEVVADPLTKVVYGIPSLIIWAIIIYGFYKYLSIRKKK